MKKIRLVGGALDFGTGRDFPTSRLPESMQALAHMVSFGESTDGIR